MRLDDVKYNVILWFKDKRYAQSVVPLIVVSVLLGASVLWIGSFFIGGDSYPMPKPPDSPRHREAALITEQLNADERFRFVSAAPAPDDEQTIVISGEVYTKADKAAVAARVRELTSTFTLRLDEILAMDEP